MNRIWNCITRGLRARPPTSSQSSSQCNDDNDLPISTPENEVTKFLLKHGLKPTDDDRLVLVPVDGHGNVITWTISGNKYRWHNNSNNHKLHSHIWDNIVLSAASALLLGPLARFFGNVVSKKCTKDDTLQKGHSLKWQERWNQAKSDITAFPNNSTVRSVLSKVPSVSLPCSIAHAAGQSDEVANTKPLEVVKLCGEKSGMTALAPSSHLYPGPSVENEDAVEFEYTEKTENKTSEILSEEDLERFLSSAQECAGMTYNKQGVDNYKAGNYRDAFQYFELGSEVGSSRAQFNLALCYHHGRGTKRDLDKAKKEYKRAARQGHRTAQYNLALLLLEDEANVVKIKRALFLLEKSAESGLVQAQALVGSYYAQDGIHQNMKKAVKMFQLATDNEDPLSTYHLAECYEHGLGGLVVDNGKAFDLYATAASHDHQEASYKMAMMLLQGCPEIEKNEELAIEILKKAGDLGHAKSAEKYRLLKKNAAQRNEIPTKLRTIKRQSSPSQPLAEPIVFPSDNMGISHLVIPELLGLDPSHSSRSRRFSATPPFQGISLANPLFDRHTYGSVMHRVSSLPSNMMQANVLVTRPNVTK